MEEVCRSFEITNISAEDLEDVRVILKMKVYAIVSISGDPFIDPNRWYSTAVDYRGRACPKWSNTVFHFTLHDASLLSDRVHLMFRFFCQRTFHHDRYIGGVGVPVKRLFDLVGALDSFYLATFPVQLPAGGEKGFLKLSFQFGKSLPRLIQPAPPWQPRPPHGVPLPRRHTFSHEEQPPKFYSGFPPDPPKSGDYDHQGGDLHPGQFPYPPYNFRSCSAPSAPTYDQISSDVSSSFPSSCEHYTDSDKDDAYYSSGSYDDEADDL